MRSSVITQHIPSTPYSTYQIRDTSILKFFTKLTYKDIDDFYLWLIHTSIEMI